MTNEEFAKELAIAVISKMATAPTADEAYTLYQTILQRLNKPNSTITLQTIEDHLAEQDKASGYVAFMNPLALGAAMILAGTTIIYSNTPITGWSLFVIGVLYVIFVICRFIQISRQTTK